MGCSPGIGVGWEGHPLCRADLSAPASGRQHQLLLAGCLLGTHEEQVPLKTRFSSANISQGFPGSQDGTVCRAGKALSEIPEEDVCLRGGCNAAPWPARLRGLRRP